MGADTGQHAPRVACGDLGPEFISQLKRSAGRGAKPLHLLAPVKSAADLTRAVGSYAARFALIPSAWLDESLSVLDELASASPVVCPIVVGEQLLPRTLGQALRHGLRGLLSPASDATLIARALEVIDGGEVWISRHRLLDGLMMMRSADLRASDATWRNLPALTERENAVLQCVLAGQSNKSIAGDLKISEYTVKVHLQHIYRKLGVRRRLELLKVGA